MSLPHARSARGTCGHRRPTRGPAQGQYPRSGRVLVTDGRRWRSWRALTVIVVFGRLDTVRRLAGAAALFVITSGGLATTASARHIIVIKLKSVSVATTVKDVLPKGPSKGDRYTGRDRLSNLVAQFGRPAGAVVGTDSPILTLRSATAGCVTGVANLPGGTLIFRGCGQLDDDGPVPVVGGTGVFLGARGTTVAGPGDPPTNTYRLSMP
jgi:hypothetical protein